MDNKRCPLNTHMLYWWLIGLLVLTTAIPAFSQDQPNAANQPVENTAIQEDINEYLGYDDLVLVRYLSLPYDTVMNTNVVSYFVDLGFVFLIFFPLIYLLGERIKWPYRLGFIILCILFLLISVPSAFLSKGNIPVESAGATLNSQMANPENSGLPQLAYQLKKPFLNVYTSIHQSLTQISGPSDLITYPILFLLLLVAIVLLEARISHHHLSTRVVLHFLLIFSFLWLILSSGIPWYGLLIFPLLYLMTVVGLLGGPGLENWQVKVRKGLLITATGIWAVMAFAYRLTNYEPTNEDRAKFTFMAAIAEYQTGRKDHTNAFDRTFPQYRTAIQQINQEEQSYVYRVGTSIPFFINKNDRRVLSDNFLQFFQELKREFPNDQELALALKAYGFRYILVDLNLPVNDSTKEGSLKNKFDQLMKFLYQNPQLQLIATDRIVRSADGSLRFEVFPVNETVENLGWFAAYQIL